MRLEGKNYITYSVAYSVYSATLQPVWWSFLFPTGNKVMGFLLPAIGTPDGTEIITCRFLFANHYLPPGAPDDAVPLFPLFPQAKPNSVIALRMPCRYSAVSAGDNISSSFNSAPAWCISSFVMSVKTIFTC